MDRGSHLENWMINKYGDKKIPFTKTLEMNNTFSGVDGKGGGEDTEFDYYYQRRTNTGVNETERYPKRTFKVKNPQTYDGSLGLQDATTFNNTDAIFIVNGEVNKADGNYLANRFFIKTIGDTNIACGSCVMDGGDVQRVAEERCTAVLNI